MSSKTKIIVLHMKEIIYTIIFAVFLLLILALLYFMFASKPPAAKTSSIYAPGVYTSEFDLSNSTLSVEVAVTDQKIESIRISNLNESVTTMYPLLQSSLESISDQICEKQSLEDISIPQDSPYTSTLLLGAIENALNKSLSR